MKIILNKEIAKEMPNSQALGAVNAVLSYSDSFGGKTNTFKIEKNEYGVTMATRYTNGVKTSYSAPIRTVAKNIKSQ